MRRRDRLVLSCLLWLTTSGVAFAASAPATTVQRFLEAHRQGRFAEARSFTIAQANMHASLFSNWLFASSAGGQAPGTADIFLSRKFTDVFRYTITETAPGGENHAYVNAIRTSPSIGHMYTWALAPHRGATPYALIEAVDAYLTKVNFPVEESRMRFTLILEAGEWYISAVEDEKFAELQQQFLAKPQPEAPSGPAAAPANGAATPGAPGVTTMSADRGRLQSDAQFNATLQSFNAPQPPVASPEAAPSEPKKKGSILGKLLGFGGRKSKGTTLAYIQDAHLGATFDNIRDALALYSSSNNTFPGSVDIHDWQSLRYVVNRYGNKALPETEDEAGFRFLKYDSSDSGQNYTLLVELQTPQNGLSRVEVTPLGIDRAR